MFLFRIYLLYKSMKNLWWRSVNKTKITSDKILRLRIYKSIYFKIVWLFSNKDYVRDQVTYKYPNNYLSRTNLISEETDIYVKNILKTISDWNMFTNVNNDPDIHETFVAWSYSESDEVYYMDNALQYNCYLATALNRLYIKTNDEEYLLVYTKLLDGISRCIVNDHNVYKLINHPELVANPINVNKDVVMESDGFGIISGLNILVSLFRNNSDYHTTHLEEYILDRYIEYIECSDYLVVKDSSVYDLHPNALYTYISCFNYIGVKLICNNLTINDIDIFKTIVRVRSNLDIVNDMSNVVITANAIEAVLYMYYNLKDSKLLSSYSKEDMYDDCLSWLEYVSYNTHGLNPEIESILYGVYEDTGLFAGLHKRNVYRVINIGYDKLTYKKTNIYSRPELVGGNYLGAPLPYCNSRNTEYAWSANYFDRTASNKTYPMFDYIVPYSRIR